MTIYLEQKALHKQTTTTKWLALDQSRLNISARSRTSRLPWRGQFSPEFVEYLIDCVCPNSKKLLDPFCGSGTVLYEALHKGKSSVGAEVNPAAWHLAQLASYSKLSIQDQRFVAKKLTEVAAKFGVVRVNSTSNILEAREYVDTLNTENHPFVREALAAVILLGMGNSTELSTDAIARGIFATTTLLNSLKCSSENVECYLTDARCLPLENNSIDAVITSPPYINVFNYHQNYRTAAELLGWSPLEAARSEIGSNRKHRGNRFLTVVQYAMDMSQCLTELSRVMQPDAPLVIVLGRTSNVLGTPFENGTMIAELIDQSEAFDTVQCAERFFTNRYGEQIYEDILITRCIGFRNTSIEKARKIGLKSLKNAIAVVPEKNLATLENAIATASKIMPSPMLSISIPSYYAKMKQFTAVSHAVD